MPFSFSRKALPKLYLSLPPCSENYLISAWRQEHLWFVVSHHLFSPVHWNRSFSLRLISQSMLSIWSLSILESSWHYLDYFPYIFNLSSLRDWFFIGYKYSQEIKTTWLSQSPNTQPLGIPSHSFLPKVPISLPHLTFTSQSTAILLSIPTSLKSTLPKSPS